MTESEVDRSQPGVSFVVPVRDGERFIGCVLDAILAEDDGRPFEVVVVDDGSSDGTADFLVGSMDEPRLRVIQGEGRGAAAAINIGIRAAKSVFIAQVDQDVVLQAGWVKALLAAFDDPEVAGAQGYYATDRDASPWARVAGYDLELRYARIVSRHMDHICTGNSIYRAAALDAVGLFDETLGYGYDNDMSYRLGNAGYRLAFVRKARSVHHWREGPRAYLRQQYGQGYGRLDLVAKHPNRMGGDAVSGPGMILHVPGTSAALAAAGVAIVLAALGRPWGIAAAIAAALLLLIGGERSLAAVVAARRFRDPAALLLLPAHLGRNVAWVWASLMWGWHRLTGRGRNPGHSMRPRGG